MKTLTPSEERLVVKLLRLYDAVAEHGSCRRGCECDVCLRLEDAGNEDVKTFVSLEELKEKYL